MQGPQDRVPVKVSPVNFIESGQARPGSRGGFRSNLLDLRVLCALRGKMMSGGGARVMRSSRELNAKADRL